MVEIGKSRSRRHSIDRCALTEGGVEVGLWLGWRSRHPSAPARIPLQDTHGAAARRVSAARLRSRYPSAPASAPAWFVTSPVREDESDLLAQSAPVGTRSDPVARNAQRCSQKRFRGTPAKSAPVGSRVGTRVICNTSCAAVRFCTSSAPLFILLNKRPDDPHGAHGRRGDGGSRTLGGGAPGAPTPFPWPPSTPQPRRGRRAGGTKNQSNFAPV